MSEKSETKPVVPTVPANALTGKQLEELSGKGFADYEAARSGKSADKGTQEDVSPPDGDDDNTAVQPEKTDDTGASPETEDVADGTADAGEKAADSKTSDDLPKGVKRRLEREKRKTEAARREAAEWRKKAEALEANKSDGADGTPKDADQGDNSGEPTDPPAATNDEPMNPDDYDYDYPEEEDYLSGPDDAEGLAAFLEDVDRWEENIPLKGGKHAASTGGEGGDTKSAPAETKPEPKTETNLDVAGEPDEQQVVNQLFDDLFETLEDDDAPEDLAQDFRDQLASRKFTLSREMLEWMADHDEAAKVAEQFVKSPRVANRLFRAPSSKHAKLLDEMVKNGGNSAKATKDNRSGKAVVGDINGRRPADPKTRLVKADTFSDYEKARAQL